jgi:hypothetical protein
MTLQEYRLNEMHQYIATLKELPLKEKLVKVNFFFNQYNYQDDVNRQGYDVDSWDDRDTFIARGYGDCEEYAIAKYQTLRELGVNSKNMYLTMVKVKGNRGHHMVLIYTQNNVNYVLDNLSWKILPLSERTDLQPIVGFNESYLVDHKLQGLSVKALAKYTNPKKWFRLLAKIGYKKQTPKTIWVSDSKMLRNYWIRTSNQY